MKAVALGAGVVGIATAYFLAKHGRRGWAIGWGAGHAMADLVASRQPEVEMSGFALADQ